MYDWYVLDPEIDAQDLLDHSHPVKEDVLSGLTELAMRDVLLKAARALDE